jgi:DNA-binding Lrp family transcriptional regulator
VGAVRDFVPSRPPLLLGVSKEAEVGGLWRVIVKIHGRNVDDACEAYIKGIQRFLRVQVSTAHAINWRIRRDARAC